MVLVTALIGFTAAFAADKQKKPDETKPAASATVITLQLEPELSAITHRLADVKIKPRFAHTFDSGWIWGGSFEEQYKNNAANEQMQLYETTLGRGIKHGDVLTLPISAGVGFAHDT